MAEPRVAQKGPFMKNVEAGKDYWWCACGQSKTQPFCDGSHKGGPFTPVQWKAASTKDVLFLRLQAQLRQAALRRKPQQAVSALSRPAVPRLAERLAPAARGLALAGALAALAACSAKTLPCPTAKILRDAASVTVFAPGQPADAKAVQYVGNISQAKLSCSYDVSTLERLEVALGVQVTAERPPASTAAAADLRYFVAIVNLEGEVLAKKEFPLSLAFPKGGTSASTVDESRQIIPLKYPQNGGSVEIWVGFQLSPEELDYNRKHLGG